MTHSSRAGLVPPTTRAGRSALLAAALLLATTAPAGAQAEPLRDPRHAVAIEEASAALRRLVAEGAFPGVGVAVAVRGEPVWSEGFGRADVARSVPATRATRFGLGSISKTFTMAAAAALHERGVLDLDARVETWLSGFPAAGRGVTLRRLAAHQSGLSDAFAGEAYWTDVRYPTVAGAYDAILPTAEPLHAAGSRVEYATGLYTIIGRAMEVAAGRPYLELLDELVLAPAGITSVAFNDRRSPPAGMARLYVPVEGGEPEPAPYFDPSHKLAGAGLVATAEDVVRLGVALLRPGVLGDVARREMLRAVPLADGTATEFALGLRVGEDPAGRRLIHQPGGGPGISTWLFLYPDQDVVVAILSNLTGAPVGGSTREAVAGPFLAGR